MSSTVPAPHRYDLRPTADAIAAEAISRASRLPSNKTLFLLMPEDHLCADDVYLQQLVIMRLDKWAQDNNQVIATGQEFSHVYLPGMVLGHTHTELPHPYALKSALKNSDADGRRALALHIAHEEHGVLLDARKNLFEFLRSKSIPTRFIDADPMIYYGGLVLNEMDEETKEEIKKVIPHMQGEAISVSSENGFRVRNPFLVNKAREHARESGARIYILQCGSSHIYGWGPARQREKAFPFAQSVAGHLAKSRAAVMAVSMNSHQHGLGTLSSDILAAKKKYDFFVQGVRDDFLEESTDADAILAAAAGGDIQIYDIEALAKELTLALERDMPLWLRDAQMALKAAENAPSL